MKVKNTIRKSTQMSNLLCVSSIAVPYRFFKAIQLRIFMFFIFLPFQKTFADTLSDKNDGLQQQGVFYIVEGTVIKNLDQVTAEKKNIVANSKLSTDKKIKYLVRVNKPLNKKNSNTVALQKPQIIKSYWKPIVSGSESAVEHKIYSSVIIVQNNNTKHQKKQKQTGYAEKFFHLIMSNTMTAKERKYFLYRKAVSEVIINSLSIRPPPSLA